MTEAPKPPGWNINTLAAHLPMPRPTEMPPTQADYCRYGACKRDEKHAPGCTEWAPGELSGGAA